MALTGIYVRTSIETDGTSIEQQKKLGIKFCDSHDFQYQIYEDIGKSGYKIDDEKDPFKNRHGLTKLIEDIEKKVIDKIWVYEHSRLSRNQYASFILSRIFERNSVIIYENGKQFKMDDPQSQMIQGILTQISQYERHLITSRTTRGLRATINTGLRTYNKIYGYRKAGNTNKYIKWEPVESEIENIKYSFQEYLNGKSVDGIIRDLNNNLPEDKRVLFHKNYINVLRRFDYTGFSLTTDGSELYRKYKNLEIENLDFLKQHENGKPKYYLNSINYPVQVVSLDDWIAVAEKLRGNKLIYKNMKRRTDTEIFTGLINCPYCNLNYYFHNDNSKGHNYHYYTHTPSKKCLQRPKSIRRNKINSIAELFFFYFYLVHDDTKEMLEESQKLLNLDLLKIKEKISAVEKDNRKLEKQIFNLQSFYEDENISNKALGLALEKESKLTLKLESNIATITKFKTNLSELSSQLNHDKMDLTYHNIEDLIINFIEKWGVEEKRAALIKVIKHCKLFGVFLIIDTGKILFVFNTLEENILPKELYEKFKAGIYFKSNFLNTPHYINEDGYPTRKGRKKSKENMNEFVADWANYYLSRFLEGKEIQEYFLNQKGMEAKMKNRFKKLGIDYKISGHKKIVSFTEEF